MEQHLGQSIRPNKPEDFEYFRSLCENEENWDINYNNDVTVHSRGFPGTTSRCIRVRGEVRGVCADTMFDCICDDEYRNNWDTVRLDSSEIFTLDRHTNLSYYCLKCPFPIQNRDLVFQRMWREVSGGYIIMNHSVELPSHPPIPGVVRAASLITGYYVVNSDSGCVATYLSHGDPKVLLPQWLCDKIGTYMAPRVFRKLYTAAEGYEEWKDTHRPDYKPWRFEEQRRLEQYADPSVLVDWGFPPPPDCLRAKGISTEAPRDSDEDSFHSADEGDDCK